MAFKRRTFVIGAGASYELGFPTGRGLLETIANLIPAQDQLPGIIHSNDFLRDGLQSLFQNGNSNTSMVAEKHFLADLSWVAQNAELAPSIDNFLHTHKENTRIVNIGKFLLAHVLSEAEKHSCLMPEKKESGIAFLHRPAQTVGHSPRKVSGKESWLAPMFWLLAEGSTFEDFLKKLKKISFVSFNYDRCIQHYIINAAASYFKLGQIDLERVSTTLNVLFPYGSLGSLRVTGGKAHGFGQIDNAFSASQGLQTFTEQASHNTQVEIAAALAESQEIVFLGFGFLDLNLKLLFDLLKDAAIETITGTALGLSQSSIELVRRSLHTQLRYKTRHAGIVESSITLYDSTCFEFFRNSHFQLRV